MPLRRARGVILRLARRRAMALAVGSTIAAPAGWLELSGGSGVWWLDGLAFLAAATGAALIWAGLTGPRPDWVNTTGSAETAGPAEEDKALRAPRVPR